MAQHARLSASASHRWMNCPGSVAASDPVPHKGSSFFAMEGTAAHLLGETCVRTDKEPREFQGETILIVYGDAFWATDVAEGATYDDDTSIHYGERLDGVEPDAVFTVDDDMIDAVEYYTMAVASARERLDHRREEFIELYMDMGWLHPALGGTADFLAVEHFGWAELVDYKHGKGVVVEVRGNPQLKKYAVGARHMFPDCEGVRLTIVQPRAPHEDGPIRSIEYTAEELDDFAKELQEAALATERPNAPLRAGEWCGFCPAKAYTDEAGNFHECQELISAVQEAAGADFDDEPAEITAPTQGQDLARAAKWVKIMDKWARDVEGSVQRELEAGRPVPGFKLVRKKANRIFAKEVEEKDPITDEVETIRVKMTDEEVVKSMRKAGITKTKCYGPPKLKSPAQMEKMGAAAKKHVALIGYKPEGGLTVAEEDDPRPAVDVSTVKANDFPDDLEE